MKGKLHTGVVFISSELIATDMAAHHLTHRLIVHKTPEWTSCRPIAFSQWGVKALSCSYECQQHQGNASEAHI